jgi:hypothetical protein
MSVEMVEAIGTYIVMPLVFCFVAWLLLRDW